MKTVAFVQARVGSTRLPNKVMKKIVGKPMIELLLERLNKSNSLDKIVLVTSNDTRNKPLVEHVKMLGYDVFEGSEHDVLDRYYRAATQQNADVVVRITGDCPFIDPELVDEVIQKFIELKIDYVSNNFPPTFPDGLDVEVFTYSALARAWKESSENFDREHVTPFIKQGDRFSTAVLSHSEDLSSLRWTVDEAADFDVATKVFEYFSPRHDFAWEEILRLQTKRPEMFEINQHIVRNEGSVMGSGQKLWKYAKQIIPGGSMLLSKRAEMFLPDQWPSYFSRSKGCKVWDLDGKEYIDMSLMGVGTNILGYGHPEVDEAVHRAVDSGVMSTLNSPEEVHLAAKLIELHPWADMARFCRSGGEANAVAIRIARAASGRDKVAICGYHGWHDWYLSANLSDDKNLDGHLLPGLEPKGVPENLRGTVFPFTYNNYEELERLTQKHDIGVIKMEVSRNHGPEDDFLLKVRNLATAKNIVLVFDECTSGFRQTFGGLHKLYGVEPDLAMFGKALGNGYAITAVIGKKKIMEAAQSTFISSTFWTERLGPSAALKTLEVMAREKSWEKITSTGLQVMQGWKNLAEKHDLTISVSGLASLATFSFTGKNPLAYKTLMTQEMLNKGYLAGPAMYSCIAHSTEIIKEYFENLDPVFALIRECEDGRDVIKVLKGPICHAGFKRLN
ncbi:MAG: aminotransferase class III-fold pyridoxal phosphate-dependent enzyme [Sphingobacteriales bacterium]|nr:MAG: aminotransferase class III-fold pyridoxal phosphate-dependent enzyme [Sphingobacteriales bacterium]